MALSDYIYSAGTISVTQNQKGFTGAGTAWLLRGAVGAIVIVGGVLNVVGVVTAENAGEFMDAWSGPTLANVPYKMWLVTAEAATNLANHYRLAQIIASIDSAQPANRNLSGLADLAPLADTLGYFIDNQGHMDLVAFKAWARSLLGLTMAANKLPYGSGANTMALADLTAAGRALLDDADASAQLTTLGVSAFAKTILDDASGAAMWATMGGANNNASSGWRKYPNADIEQWFLNGIPSGGFGTIPFPLAFPNACYGVVGTVRESSGASFCYVVDAGSVTATNFYATGHTVQAGSVALSAPGTLWRAWGR